MKVKFQNALKWARAAMKRFSESNCSLHAAGLTYFSMLALMPALCILLSLAKVLGAGDLIQSRVNEQIETSIKTIEEGQESPFLAVITGHNEEQNSTSEERREAAREFAAQARSLSNSLFERVAAFDVGKLGWIGVIFLLWTVISSIAMVEVSLNEIWNVRSNRAIWKQCYLYIGVGVAMPILVLLAVSPQLLKIAKDAIISLGGSLWIVKSVSKGLVALIDSAAFRCFMEIFFSSLSLAFLYWFLPNTRVAFKSAWKGGAVAAFLLWGWMKLCTVAQIGIAKSSMLYGSFALLPIILAWMYMSWQIMLFGAVLARMSVLSGKKE